MLISKEGMALTWMVASCAKNCSKFSFPLESHSNGNFLGGKLSKGQ